MTWSRRHVIDPTLNLEEILQSRPENKKYDKHTSRESWTFSPKRNEACSLLINGVICKKPPWRIKNSMSSKYKKAHKLETVKCILEKTIMLLETS